MKGKSERFSFRGLILVLFAIAAGVAAVVYALESHRKHLNDQKWKDYDECGLT